MMDELRALIETERERFNVAGVGIAIVIDGEVALAEGFGVRDLQTQTPVDSQTMFPIASDTKAFAGAGLAALAAEGKFDLDAPIRTYIPWFEMYDPRATAEVSARDLLSHRTGLPRHDFVWYGELGWSNEEIVRKLRYLQPNKQLRQVWQYNNLCFTTAGYLTEVLSGQSWADFITDRFFGPLGMKHSGFYKRSLGDGNFATPYLSIDDERVKQTLPLRDDAAPSGGAVSTAEDLAQWLLARLGKDVSGTRVLSDTALTQLHTPAMLGAAGSGAFPERQSLGYGLGTQVEAYRGHRRIFHGGNLVGFSSDISVIPGSNCGVAILTNQHGTALRDALPLMIYDKILGLEPIAWGERFHEIQLASESGANAASAHKAASAGGRPHPRPVEAYAGTYTHPAYGEFNTLVKGAELDVDFHELGDKVSLTHRDTDVWTLHLAEFPTMKFPVVFRSDSDGDIVELTVPLEGSVEPIVFIRRPGSAPDGLLDALVGAYEMGPQKLRVDLRGDDYFVAVAGLGAKLVSRGGTKFGIEGTPQVSLEVDYADGVVSRVLVDPVGFFTPVVD